MSSPVAFPLLLPRQDQQLGVRGQHFADGILKLTPCPHTAAHILDPFLGDVLDLLFPLHHKRQRPDRMAVAFGAMTGALATAQMTERERAGEAIRRDMETAHEFELALSESGCQRASGFVVHLNV